MLGVLAGADFGPELLARWAASADLLVAADAGADRLRESGFSPDVVVGDMDSVSGEGRAFPAISSSDQDTTDADKLLAHVASLGHRMVTLAGVEGDRLDHVLASVSSAVRSELAVRLALRSGIAWVVKPGRTVAVAASEGAPVSLIPVLESIAFLSGVAWPLERHRLQPGGLVSISNRAIGGEVHASIEEGAALLVIGFEPAQMPFWDE